MQVRPRDRDHDQHLRGRPPRARPRPGRVAPPAPATLAPAWCRPRALHRADPWAPAWARGAARRFSRTARCGPVRQRRRRRKARLPGPHVRAVTPTAEEARRERSPSVPFPLSSSETTSRDDRQIAHDAARLIPADPVPARCRYSRTFLLRDGLTTPLTGVVRVRRLGRACAPSRRRVASADGAIQTGQHARRRAPCDPMPITKARRAAVTRGTAEARATLRGLEAAGLVARANGELFASKASEGLHDSDRSSAPPQGDRRNSRYQRSVLERRTSEDGRG
jgi:hypothetical protein